MEAATKHSTGSAPAADSLARSKEQSRSKLLDYAATVLFAALLLVGIFLLDGIAPFGPNSLTDMDANNQYLDFFAYLKDVLCGENSILYTSDKGLGDTAISLFAYYLSSPINLIIAFFDKGDLVLFYDIVAFTKITLAALLTRIYLQHRFSVSERNLKQRVAALLISVGYGLCNFSMMQSCNIMWLDGMYMLPLMALGVYRFVSGKRGGGTLLSVSTALSIFFNWYTAGINCLFCAALFFVEWALYCVSRKNATRNGERNASIHGEPLPSRASGRRTQGVAGFFKTGVGFAFHMVLGLALSAALFLPMAIAMQASSKGSFDLSILCDLSFVGNPLSLIGGFSAGAISTQTSVSIQCGSVALIGCVAFFLSRNATWEEKVVLGAFAVFAVLVLYWNPLYRAFSLFQEVWSFWCRHAYTGSFCVMFIAAFYYLRDGESRKMPAGGNGGRGGRGGHERWNRTCIIVSGAICSLSIFVYCALDGGYYMKYVAFTCVMVICIAALLALGDYLYDTLPVSENVTERGSGSSNGKNATHAPYAARYPKRHRAGFGVATAFVIALVATETVFASSVVIRECGILNNEEFGPYAVSQQAQIDALTEYDDSLYRISQTSTRHMRPGNLTANYNEPLAYGYMGISEYASTVSDTPHKLLERLGYTRATESMNYVNTSIVGADSLLGVRYVLSSYPINGYEAVEEVSEANGKSVYENPFALPLALRYSAGSSTQGGEAAATSEQAVSNTFEYQNALYSELAGQTVTPYEPLGFTVSGADADAGASADAGGTIAYELQIPAGHYAVYGNIPTDMQGSATVYVDGELITAYSKWLAPSVFYVPVDDENADSARTATVTLVFDSNFGSTVGDAQFYALDLEEFAEVTERIQQKAVQTIRWENGDVAFSAAAAEGESLLVSIPNADGWTITVNGTEVAGSTFAGCLYSIPLSEGDNTVEMHYELPGLKKGIAFSVAGAIVLIVCICLERRRAAGSRTNRSRVRTRRA